MLISGAFLPCMLSFVRYQFRSRQRQQVFERPLWPRPCTCTSMRLCECQWDACTVTSLPTPDGDSPLFRHMHVGFPRILVPFPCPSCSPSLELLDSELYHSVVTCQQTLYGSTVPVLHTHVGSIPCSTPSQITTCKNLLQASAVILVKWSSKSASLPTSKSVSSAGIKLENSFYSENESEL